MTSTTLTFFFLQHLEESVQSGLIQRHENKGNVSYKDPDSLPRGKSKALKLSPASDLTKVFVKAVRELGEIDGSTIRSIEKFVVSSYEIEFEQVILKNILLILY